MLQVCHTSHMSKYTDEHIYQWEPNQWYFTLEFQGKSRFLHLRNCPKKRQKEHAYHSSTFFVGYCIKNDPQRDSSKIGQTNRNHIHWFIILRSVDTWW